AGEPERLPAAHARKAHQRVLDGVIETVTHVQLRRHVGRRHHDHVRRKVSGRWPGLEEAALLPALVERAFDAGRIVLRVERCGHACWSLRGISGIMSRSSSPRTSRPLETGPSPAATSTRAARARSARDATHPRNSTPDPAWAATRSPRVARAGS